jgi:hypothetical protein
MQSCDAQAATTTCVACDGGDSREHVDTKSVVSAALGETGDACAVHAARARATALAALALERATDAVACAERAEALQLAAALAAPSAPAGSPAQHPPTPPQLADDDAEGDDDARTAAAAASLAAPAARKKPRLMLLSDASELATELPQITSLDANTQAEALRKLASTRRGCRECGALKTPQWRSGPAGAKTLCNACGVRHLKLHRAHATPQTMTEAAPAHT